jgi:hypothetical protein
MKQIRISKQHRPARKWVEPLPLELRDPDVVRAKQLARRADSRSQRQRRHAIVLPKAPRLTHLARWLRAELTIAASALDQDRHPRPYGNPKIFPFPVRSRDEHPR